MQISGVFGRFRWSVSIRQAILLLLTFCVAVAVLAVVMSLYASSLVRHDYEHRAQTAVQTILASMPREDQQAIENGRQPSPESVQSLETMLQANGFEGVTFWYGGRPVLQAGMTQLGTVESAWNQLQESAGRWQGGSTTIKIPGSRVWLAFSSSWNKGDPIVVTLPYGSVRGGISPVVAFACLITILIAIVLGLLPGFFIMRNVSGHLRVLSQAAAEAAAGRLTVGITPVESADAIGELYRNIGSIQANLGSLVRNMSIAANEVESSSVALDAATREASHSSISVAETMNELSSGVTELASTIRLATELVADMTKQISQASQAAETVSSLSQETLGSTETGLEAVSVAVENVGSLSVNVRDLALVADDLRARSGAINEVVEFIGGVAEQTNLLALNASIEAARAGEFGATFSVLAERIHSLSLEASSAGDKITAHINSILEGIDKLDDVVGSSKATFEKSANRVEQAGQLFAQIGLMVKEITTQAEMVSANAANLFTHSKQANEEMQNIAAFSEETAASVEEVAATSEEQAAASEQMGKTASNLVQMANALRDITNRFEI